MAVIEQDISARHAAYCGDCMEVLPRLKAGAVHFSIYSPPFAGLYHYSSSARDLSNCASYDQFFQHFGFVVREIARVTMPGRMTAVHCMDVPSGNSGGDHLIDFPGDIIRLHAQEGFRYTHRYHVWKEPLTVRNRTMSKGLAHQTVVEDSSRCSVASADYLLIFRRDGQNPVPIAHPHGLMDYAGARPMPAELQRFRGWTGNQIENRYSHWIWRRYADAFWDDVRLDRVLPYREARDSEDEKHVHPLQLDVIERAVTLFTNPGETVLTPFMGVGSEVFTALRMARKGIGIELKPSYYRQALKNIATVDRPDTDQASFAEEFDRPLDQEVIELSTDDAADLSNDPPRRAGDAGDSSRNGARASEGGNGSHAGNGHAPEALGMGQGAEKAAGAASDPLVGLTVNRFTGLPEIPVPDGLRRTA